MSQEPYSNATYVLPPSYENPPETTKTKISHLLGRVLTILDASYAEEKQRKAVKDLVKREFYALLNELSPDFFSAGTHYRPHFEEDNGTD